MSGLDTSIGLLNKTTFTEYRYTQLYVAGRCRLVALVNRILFYLFSSCDFVLRDAAGPISLQEEQAALRSYNTAKSALLLSQNEKTIEAFNRALNIRAKQLCAFDSTLSSAVKTWWQSDIQNEELIKRVSSFPLEKVKKESQASVEQIVALFSQNRDLQAEPLKSAVTKYATMLCAHGDDFNLSVKFLYKRLNEDVWEAYCANNRRYPLFTSPPPEVDTENESIKFISIRDILLLKLAIFEALPLEKSFDLDTMFLHIFSSECRGTICGKLSKDSLDYAIPYTEIMQSMACFVASAEIVYRKLALRLGQNKGANLPDLKRLIEYLAFDMLLNIDPSLLEAYKEKSEQNNDEELLNFLTLHYNFTCKKEQETPLVLENRAIFISSVARRAISFWLTNRKVTCLQASFGFSSKAS
jgi:hypothetical protein